MSTAHIRAATLDDLLREALEAIRSQGRPVTATRGDFSELTGLLLELENPLARLSRTETRGRPFSALGEFCWYLSGRNDHESIKYYLDKAYRPEDVAADGTLPGAYGPRLVGPSDGDQLERVVTLLQKRETTRQAVLQLFDASDLRSGQTDVPCTCTIQFLNREGRLNAITYMRSNDVYLGVPHDIFCFTLLQEWLSRRLGTELGTYKHAVGSLHLYEKHAADAQQFLDEGFQSTLSPMPPMPSRDPQAALKVLLDAEDLLRGATADLASVLAKERQVDPYWGDLIRLLRAYRHFKDGNAQAISKLRQKMASKIYDPFLARLAQRGKNVSARSAD